MRTKALLVGAAIGAVSLVTSMAQVYSVNIVGYVNATVPHGWSIMHNPLNASPNNQAINVIPYGSNEGIFNIFKWSTTLGRYQINAFDGTAPLWDVEDMVFNPGEGFFIYNYDVAKTITFVGEVCTGDSTDPKMQTPLVTGWNMVGSKVPQAGFIQADLGYVPQGPAEYVYQYSNALGRYLIRTWDPEIAWDPDAGGEPNLGMAEAVWIYRMGGAGAWARTFNVGP